MPVESPQLACRRFAEPQGKYSAFAQSSSKLSTVSVDNLALFSHFSQQTHYTAVNSGQISFPQLWWISFPHHPLSRRIIACLSTLLVDKFSTLSTGKKRCRQFSTFVVDKFSTSSTGLAMRDTVRFLRSLRCRRFTVVDKLAKSVDNSLKLCKSSLYILLPVLLIHTRSG